MTHGLPKSLERAAPALAQVKKVSIPFKDVALTVAAVGSAVGFGSVTLAGLPEGNLKLLGAVAYLQLDTASANLATSWHGDFGIGYVATTDADLGDAAEDAIIASTTIDAVASTKTSAIVRGASTATEEVIYDNTAGTAALKLNVLVDAGDITDDQSGVMHASGIVHLAYIVLGDD